jgi:hypothetical protein
MGTGKGWSEKESLLACKAFVAASEDPTHGNGKKRESFAGEVLNHYERLWKELRAEEPVHDDLEKRSGDAVLQRYKKVRAEALKFEGFLKTIRSGRPTGDPRTEDMERAATAMYNGRAEVSDMYSYMTENHADPGREFPFLKCLYYLRTTTQWRTMQLSSTEFQRNGHENSDNIDVVVADDGSTSNSGNGGCVEAGPDSSAKTHMQRLERPVGAKRAIEAQQTTIALERGARGI